MSKLYAMRRANGDWFALDDKGHLRVPVFRSSRHAMVARGRNWGMQLFAPAVLDGRALDDIAPAGGESPVSFWLVENPSARLSRGHPLEFDRLSLLVEECGKTREVTV